MTQEMEKFTIAVMRLALSDIARDGNSCPTRLIRKAVNLPLGEFISSIVDGVD